MNNPLSSTNTLYPYPDSEDSFLRFVRQVIPASTMSAARQKAKKIGATANDLLLAAFYQAYAHTEGTDPHVPMSITSMMDLRRHCKNGESEGLCNLSGALPTTLPQGVPGNFSDTLAEVCRQTTVVKQNPYAGLEGIPLLHSVTRTLPIWLLLLLTGKVYGKMSLGLTNLGNLSCADLALGSLIPTGGMFGGPVKKKPGMQISAISFDGNCVLTVIGPFTSADASLLQSTLRQITAEIENYAFSE